MSLKNLIYLICVTSVLALAMVECNDPEPYEYTAPPVKKYSQAQPIELPDSTFPFSNDSKAHIIVYDSCEWIAGWSGCTHEGGPFFAHRPRCKFCAERRKVEFLELLKQSK